MFEVIIISGCLLVNAILAGTEMAFVTVGKPRLRELARSGNEEAVRILSLRENPERTLSVIQVGITLVGAIGAAVGGAGAEEFLDPLLRTRLGLSEATAEFIAISAVVVPITFLNVVIGELVPKTLALRDPIKIVLKTARWLVLFDRILAPVVSVLEWSTKSLLRMFFRKAKTDSAGTGDITVELDQLSQQARQYVLNIVGIEKKKVKDVFLPWEQVAAVDAKLSSQEVENIVLTSGHTRLPVLEADQMIGILNTKEFITLKKAGETQWRDIVRPLVQVQESDSLLNAFRKMQENRSHLSIVYRGPVRIGIVTMEDILEEVIGEIYDEDDDGALRQILSASATLKNVVKGR